MYRNNKMKRFVRYIRRTFKQKLYALALAGLGALTAVVSDGDATAFVFMLLLAVPMFISKENWIA